MRGANGAILVTTKRGEKGKTMINFTQEVGFQTLTDKMENQNSYNMALTQNRVKYLNGQDPLWSEEQIAEYKFVSEGGKYADDDIRRKIADLVDTYHPEDGGPATSEPPLRRSGLTHA